MALAVVGEADQLQFEGDFGQTAQAEAPHARSQDRLPALIGIAGAALAAVSPALPHGKSYP